VRRTEGLHARSNIGYLPGDGIYSDLTGRPVDGKRRRELQDRLGLPDRDLRRTLKRFKPTRFCSFSANPPKGSIH